MRRRVCEWFGVGLALAACGAHGSEPAVVSEPVGAVTSEPARVIAATTSQASEPVAEAERRSCRVDAPARKLALQHGASWALAGARSFVLGWRSDGGKTDTVVIGVDAVGEPQVTAVPLTAGDPLAMGADRDGLVIVSVPRQGSGVMVRVALMDDGALRVGAATPLPEIGWGWPGAIAVQGSRALVQHTLATAQQSLGEEVLYTVDLAAGKVVAERKTGGRSVCSAGACTTLTMHEGVARLRRRTPAGDEASGEVALTSGCPAVYSVGEELLVLPGAPWRAVAVAGKQLRAVDVADTLVPIAGCGAVLPEFPSRRWPGLVSEGSLLRWDAAGRRFGAAEGLPRAKHERVAWFEQADGVIEIGWRGGSGMMHSPTDAQGRRRYFKRWFFEGGEVRLLRREAGGFVASEVVPLALAGAEGSMHEGYEPTLLRSGAHAVVFIASQGGGDDSWWQPYLGPCVAR